MKSILIIALIVSSSISLLNKEQNQLISLLLENKISHKEFKKFDAEIKFKSEVGTYERLDSLESWELDIVYTEEFYFPRKDSFLVREYYFSSERFDSIKNNKTVYKAEKYFENGKESKRFFFEDDFSREHLQSIIKHMNNRKVIDTIFPLAKTEIEHAGCGMSRRTVENVRETMNFHYRKAKKPKYYLIETFNYKGNISYSFQRPIKTKFKVIVEGHSF
ncbi:MAG: hypothetical protein ACPGVD_08430 [Flavobacteriales bacterium]